MKILCKKILLVVIGYTLGFIFYGVPNKSIAQERDTLLINPRACLTIVHAKYIEIENVKGIYHGYFYWPDTTDARCDSVYPEPFCFGYLYRDYGGQYAVLEMFPMTGAYFPTALLPWQRWQVRIIKTDGRP